MNETVSESLVMVRPHFVEIPVDVEKQLQLRVKEIYPALPENRYDLQARLIKAVPEGKAEILAQPEIDLTQEDCQLYFQKAEKRNLNYGDFLSQIPTASEGEKPSKSWEQWALSWFNSLEKMEDQTLAQTIKEIMSRLSTKTYLPEEISPETFLNLRDLYGLKGKGLIHFLKKFSILAKDFENKEVFAQAAEWLAKSLHGKTRVEVLKQMGLLERLAHASKENQKQAIEEIVVKGKNLITPDEEEKQVLNLIKEGAVPEEKPVKPSEEEEEEAIAEEAKVKKKKAALEIGPKKSKAKDHFGFPAPLMAENNSAHGQDRGGTYASPELKGLVANELLAQRGRLYVIADGMTIEGSAKKAEGAVAKFTELYYSLPWRGTPLDHAFYCLPETIFAVQNFPGETTFSFAIISPDNNLYASGVGNSPVSVWENGRQIAQLKDQSQLVWEKEKGSRVPITREEAEELRRQNPQRKDIFSETPELEQGNIRYFQNNILRGVSLGPGRIVTLRTDGVDFEKLRATLASPDGLKRLADVVAEPRGDDQFLIVAQP